MAASASGGRVPKQPAAADGQPEKPSKQAKTSTALRNVRMSTDFMVHELYRKLDGGTSEPSTLVEFFSLLTERLSSDGMADPETEQTTGTLLSDLKHEERQAGMALRQALVPIKHMTEACKQCEALLVNELAMRARNTLVREFDVEDVLSTALKKVVAPFVRDQTSHALKHAGSSQYRFQGLGKHPGGPLPPPPPGEVKRKFEKGDGGYSTRQNRFGQAITCNNCRQDGHFAWECERLHGPQPKHAPVPPAAAGLAPAAPAVAEDAGGKGGGRGNGK